MFGQSLVMGIVELRKRLPRARTVCSEPRAVLVCRAEWAELSNCYSACGVYRDTILRREEKTHGAMVLAGECVLQRPGPIG
jgi:hypothetical protein